MFTSNYFSVPPDLYQFMYVLIFSNVFISLVIIFQIKTVFHDVSAAVVYDVLHDQEYRSKWDKYSLEVKDIGHLNPNNLIGYFACKCTWNLTSIFLTEFNVFLAKKVTQMYFLFLTSNNNQITSICAPLWRTHDSFMYSSRHKDGLSLMSFFRQEKKINNVITSSLPFLFVIQNVLCSSRTMFPVK